MKRWKSEGLACLVALMLLSGCSNKTETGALVGGGVGVGVGALVSHSPAGAVVGGVVGATAGALVGYAMDEKDRAALQKSSPQTVQRIDNKMQLRLSDIIAMSQAGLSDETICAEIDATHSVFFLDADNILLLNNKGVSQKVITKMIQTGDSEQ